MTPSVSRWGGDVVARLSRHRAAAAAARVRPTVLGGPDVRHWPVRPEDVAHLFPPGTRPDVIDGMTYAGLVPFTMRPRRWAPRCHCRTSAPSPRPMSGCTRSTTPAATAWSSGRWRPRAWRWCPSCAPHSVFRTPGRGCASPDRMTSISYDSERRWPRRGLRSRLTVRIGDAVAADPAGGLADREVGCAHPQGRADMVGAQRTRPWPLRSAEILELDDDLMAAAGIAVAGDRLRALFSPGVHARFGRPSRVK